MGVIIWLITCILHRFSIAYTENWRWILPLYCYILITTNSKTITVFWSFQHKKWFLFYSSSSIIFFFFFFCFIIIYSSQSNNTITYFKTCLVWSKIHSRFIIPLKSFAAYILIWYLPWFWPKNQSILISLTRVGKNHLYSIQDFMLVSSISPLFNNRNSSLWRFLHC